MRFLLVAALVFLVGCETDKQIRLREMHQKTWDACLDGGGIPIGSWFNAEVLSDCIYKPPTDSEAKS